jgi:DNA-binding response OmpR family regulator
VTGISILVIEDELTYSEEVSNILRRAGYLVQVVENELEVVDALNQKKFDVVVMNAQLPGIGEISLVNWMRDHCDTPIILVTAKKAVLNASLA